MKGFIINLIKFLSYLLLLTAIIVIGNYIIINSSTFWKLKNNKKYIILGHSHPECAFNDSLIPNFVNLGLSGEAYFYTYIKLKKLIANNNQLKAVFIEFGTTDIGINMDSWIWDDQHISYNLPKYLPAIQKKEMKILCDKNLSSVLSIPPRNYMREIGFSYYNLFLDNNNVISKMRRYGGYQYLPRNKSDSIKWNEEEPNYNIKHNSGINLLYLFKIVNLCLQNEIEPFLIRSPVKTKNTNSLEILFNEILINKFSNTEFLDFQNFPLENNHYKDCDHLNYKGAEIFSKWFAQLIKKGLLIKLKKQEFINEEIMTLKNK